ncbi:MAG TPA: type III secretion system cytoplasmic ring protein SctQ [Burkholderia sp.]|uniref:type III secretion system cytoplasmic ring protein SctQ n=1 Tax=Burkholderia metallica TaxID=488729 RepID=UPI000B668273|nr:type III secretion system cytoplasmic ring protein SctQ [Burkholderia metallica]OUE37359.1 hypothetical protein BZY94_36975 [Burkholderia territorii]HDR9503524.1 type III secretion system cytoplasmic ring protein SctQ [Burkholderia cepacia]HKT63759.1 type III secretion system cytoplasmic ring protein SctQ [Burkholderia sp.]
MNAEPNLPTPLTPAGAALTHIAPSVARFARALSDARFVRAARDAGLGVTVRAARAGRSSSRPAVLVLGFDDGRVRLRIDASADAALALVSTDADPARRAAAAGIVLGHVLERFAPLGLGKACVAAFDPVDEPASLDVALRHRTIEVDAGVVAVEDSVAARLEAHCRALPPHYPRRLEALRVPMRVRLGTRRYRHALLRSLRAGDVLLHALAPTLDGTLATVSVRCGFACGNQWSAAAHLSGHTLILSASPTMTSDHDTTPSDIAAVTDPVPLDTLDVPVHLELDQLVLPLSDLAALGPGHVLELELPVDETDVRLVVYGQTIGFGRLVAIGDHLGVQISRMAAPDDADS